MSLCKVVHCKKEDYDLMVDRTTIFGNPFRVEKEEDREKMVDRYRHWLQTGENYGHPDATEEKRQNILNNLDKLEGKVLGCWCKPKKCHGDVLVELANFNRILKLYNEI